MYATMEPEVNTQLQTQSRKATPASFNSETAKKAAAVRLAAPATVPEQELNTFRTLKRDDKEELLLEGLLESEFIAQYLDRQQMLSPNKKERMQTGMAVRVGIYNDKRNKQQSQSAPQNLIINLFNGSGVGSRLSQALGCHSTVTATAQVVDSVDSASPSTGEAVEQEQ
jgi:hypothetical protein